MREIMAWPERGTKIQSLIFDQAAFTVAQAKRWAKDHGFRYGKTDEKLTTIRIRQLDPTGFVKTTFRTIELRPGVKAVVGVPRVRAVIRRNGPVKKKPVPSLESQFITLFRTRDALRTERITRDAMNEIAWEMGYEGESFDRLLAPFLPLAVEYNADLRGSYNSGRDMKRRENPRPRRART